MGNKLAFSVVLLVILASAVFLLTRSPGTRYERAASINVIADRPPSPNFHDPIDYVAWMSEQFARGKADGSERAYSRLWPAPHSSDEVMAVPSKEVRTRLLELSLGPVWHPVDNPSIDEYLASVAPALALFREEVESAIGYRFVPKPDEKDPRNPIHVLLPRIDASRHAIPCLLSLAWREGADRYAQLFEAWRLGFRHARHLQESRQFLLGLKGLEIRLLVYESMLTGAGRSEFSAENRLAAISLLDDCDPGELDLQEIVRIEWGSTLGIIQSLYANGRLNRNLAETIGFVGSGRPTSVDADAVRSTGITPAQLAKAADAHFVRLLEINKGPTTFETLEELKAIGQSSAADVLRGHPLRPMIQPLFLRPFRMQFRSVTMARGTRLLLGVLAHFDEHGRLPTDLSEAGEDATARTDPGSGEEFVYSVSDPSSRMDFVLYSVGEDGVDDGGKHGPWGDLYERAVPKGRDFVFWPPQDRQKQP